jgi:hypothetical protein
MDKKTVKKYITVPKKRTAARQPVTRSEPMARDERRQK